MESHLYICEYCQKEYVPKRRRVQKYCSASCRSRSWQIKNEEKEPIALMKQDENIESVEAIHDENLPQTNDKNKPTKVEKVSAAGVANATAGSLLAEAIKAITTSKENKSATNADIKHLASLITKKRYYKITNMAQNPNGASPYFDIIEKQVIHSYINLDT